MSKKFIVLILNLLQFSDNTLYNNIKLYRYYKNKYIKKCYKEIEQFLKQFIDLLQIV